MKPLTGVIPALLTPFTDDGAVNCDGVARLVRFLLSAGVHGFYVTGTSGEWPKLSLDERKAIAEIVIAEVAGRVPIVIHVGHFSTASAVELAGHAARTGADYVSSVLPSASLAETAAYYRAIATAGLPVIAYYLEGAAGVPLNPRLFVENIKGIVGLKYTAPDMFPMQTVIHLSEGRLKVWGGHDQMALAALMMGATGVIGTSYNYMPEPFIQLYEAFRAGNAAEAARIQAEANRLSYAVKQFGQATAYKAVLEMRGLPGMGCRAPALALDAAQRKALAAAIAPFPA